MKDATFNELFLERKSELSIDLTNVNAFISWIHTKR